MNFELYVINIVKSDLAEELNISSILYVEDLLRISCTDSSGVSNTAKQLTVYDRQRSSVFYVICSCIPSFEKIERMYYAFLCFTIHLL
jgi:hypothetical protein